MARYILVALGILALASPDAGAVTCVNGVYRAGCAGPNGAAVVVSMITVIDGAIIVLFDGLPTSASRPL